MLKTLRSIKLIKYIFLHTSASWEMQQRPFAVSGESYMVPGRVEDSIINY